jgi:outer membrane usher protein
VTRSAVALALTLILAQTAVAGGARAADAPPSAAPAPAGLTQSLYAVRLDAQDVSDGAAVLVDAEQHIYADVTDVRAWRLRIPGSASVVDRDGRRYVRLDTLGKLTLTIDDAAQRLVITAPADLFEESTLQTAAKVVAATPVRANGAFLNYDVHARLDTVGASAISSALEAGFNLGGGVLTDTELAATNPGHVTRLATTWQSDDLRHDRTWQIGDDFAGEATLGGDVRFAGIRIASDYAGRDGFITSPEASVLGTAALPSTVDVYVNNVLTATQTVDPGVFRIDNLPQVDGQGNVQLVVHDLLGRSVMIDRSYFGASALLKPGLDDYELDAGISRADYGEDGSYRDALFSATERHGFDDRFTGEVHAEASNQLVQSSAVGTWLVPTIGNLSFGAAVARSPAGFGTEVLLGDQVSNLRYNYGFSLRARSPNYTDLGVATDGNASASLAANVGFHVGAHSSLAFTYAATSSGGNPIEHVFTTSFGGSLGPIQIAINAVNPLGAGSGRYFSLNLLTLVGRNSISATQNYQSGSSTPSIAIQHGATSTYAPSYALTATGGPQPYLETRVTGAQPAFDYQAAFSSDLEENETELDLRGAIASVGGHVFATRSIEESYGLVELGLPGVNVYVNNALVGRTNAAGLALVPDLQAYHANAISIDPDSLPLATNVADVKVYAAPYYRSPAVIRFKSAGEGGLIVPVRRADGTPLPSGSVVIGPDGTQWPVADRGEAYVGGLTSHTRVSLHAHAFDGTTCTMSLDVPDGLTSVPTVAPLTCR